MPEAEDVLTEAARHAVNYAQKLWQRHRPPPGLKAVDFDDMSQQLGLLTTAAFGVALPLLKARPPAPPTLLQRLARHNRVPAPRLALPATDGTRIWLPFSLPPPMSASDALARETFRLLALQQAQRAARGAPGLLQRLQDGASREMFGLLEAAAADHALVLNLPGLAPALNGLRRIALAGRPPLEAFPPACHPLERFARTLLAADCRHLPDDIAGAPSAGALLETAPRLATKLGLARDAELYRDLWTGALLEPGQGLPPALEPLSPDGASAPPARSARLGRRPDIRSDADEDEDNRPGPWMVQTAEPQEKAEDAPGLQRPTDRDAANAAEDYAEALSELPEAQLVSTPGSPREVLLSDEPLPQRLKSATDPAAAASILHYPEWDYRQGAYRVPGARIHLAQATSGPASWVASTLARHAGMLAAIERRFAMLRPRRDRLRRQLDGDEIDLEACIEGFADLRAGVQMPQALYQTVRPARRDLAVLILVDASGSTDSWIAAHRRVIDVEREALLLVTRALQSLGDPFALLAFSGEGPQQVSMRTLKDFSEPCCATVERRIAGLEPERYTRTGAALRHAQALLMQQPAEHRLLLLLSDGKPNDIDLYEGRYGVEDTARAMREALGLGISPFCLTIDRAAADYLPQMFGIQRYALLPDPERLPAVLLDWMKRLLAR